MNHLFVTVFVIFLAGTVTSMCRTRICPQTFVASPVCGYDQTNDNYKEFSSDCDLQNYNCKNRLEYIAISKEQTGCRKLSEQLTETKWENIFENLPTLECLPEICPQSSLPTPICAYSNRNSVNNYLNVNSECKMRNINCEYGQDFRAISKETVDCSQLLAILSAL